MKQAHYWAAGGCIIGIGIGYVIGGLRATGSGGADPADQASHPQQSQPSSRDRQPRTVPPDDPLAEILKGRQPQDIPEGELVDIIKRLGTGNRNRSYFDSALATHQLQLLLAKLPAEQLEQVADVFAADPATTGTSIINWTMSAMATKNPNRAIEWAKGYVADRSVLGSVIGTIAKDDPYTAAEAYRNGLLEGFFDSDGQLASFKVTMAMARLGKAPLLEFIDSLPAHQQGVMLSNGIDKLPESERAAMLDEIYLRSKDGRLREENFRYIFSKLLLSSPTQAEAWLGKMEPGQERAAMGLSVASTLSRSDPDAAREWMSRVISQSQGREDELIREAVDRLGGNHPGDIAVFAGLLPPGVELRADDLKTQARNSANRGFGGLTELAGAIRDPAEQAKLITGALNDLTSRTVESSQPAGMNATDFEILARELRTLNLTGENAAQVEAALTAARDATAKPKQ